MQNSELLSFHQGHIIFNEGDETSEMYIIIQGSVQIFKSAGGQRKILLAELGPGSMVGEMSLISGRPRSATAIAIEDVKAKVVTKAIFDKSVQGIPPWAMCIAKVLIERLRRITIIIKKEIIVDEFHAPEEDKLDYTKGFEIDYNHEVNPGFIYLKGYFFKSDISRLNETGWTPVEEFVAKARDGKTDIYCNIHRPSNFDPNKKYPVIENIYTCSEGYYVSKSFNGKRKIICSRYS